ncbi:MAG: hypothetical protein AAF694_19780 [Bacteroidota bacterium]
MQKKSKTDISRRKFSKEIFSGIVSYALLDSLLATRALARSVSPIVDHWSIRLNEYCKDLKVDSITMAEWQQQVEALFQVINLDELSNFIDFKNLQMSMALPFSGVKTRKVEFPRLTGLPKKTNFIKKVTGMRKSTSINPHGHSNLASAHLVLKGELHVRNFDRVVSETDYMVVQPTLDETMAPGQASSISDEKDNVHWFIANTNSCFTFDVVMLNLGGRAYNIHYLDMLESKSMGDDLLRVPIIDYGTAVTKYGKIAPH